MKKFVSTHEQHLLNFEKKFKEYAKITDNIDSFPLANNIANIETDKTKSKEFSEVFTPLWLVDEMIEQVNFKSANVQTLDLCAGYGQFSIRLMRHLWKIDPDFNWVDFIKKNHAFSELQLSSCYKLLTIFGNYITLFIGDSTYLNKLPEKAKGLWCYIESYGYWVCLTKTIQKVLKEDITEEEFVKTVKNIIDNLNKAYTMTQELHNVSLKQMTASSPLRLELISAINSVIRNDATKNDKLQSIDTPASVIDDMLACVDDIEKKSILVLFNCEIVEYLINKKKVDPKNITFGVEFEAALKADAMKKMYGVDTVLMKDQFGIDKFSFIHQTFKGRKFDVCLSNPPYNRGLDLKILAALMNDGTVEKSIAKEFVIVHPSTWLLDQKDKSPLYRNIKNVINNKLKSVHFFNGNAVFGVELFVPCVITNINILFNSNKTNVVYFEENFITDQIDNITKFGINWLNIVKPFMEKMAIETQKVGNIWQHNTRIIENNKIYCQTAAIRGDVNDRNKKSNATNATREIVKDNFYTMCKGFGIEECKGIREPRLNKPGGATPTFGFDSENERDNFLHYLNTDFARFCLSIYKIGQHMENGEMELIPWLDFTESWDDKKLFNHFDIDQKTQDYIREFLPDYYKLRK
jgi:hypothetical protein